MTVEISFTDNVDPITITCDDWTPVHSSRVHEFYKDHVLILWVNFSIVRTVERMDKPEPQRMKRRT